jgi:hypothetical protein
MIKAELLFLRLLQVQKSSDRTVKIKPIIPAAIPAKLALFVI